MHSSKIDFDLFTIEFKKVSVQEIDSSALWIEGYSFQSKVLAHLLEANAFIYTYCIYPSCSLCKQNVSYEQVELAEQHLLSLLKKNDSLVNPKYINPGIVFDWNLMDAEKILHLLHLDKVKYDKFTNKMIPYQTKIGFIFDAPDTYLGNCEYCQQDKCSYRKYPYAKISVERFSDEV